MTKVTLLETPWMQCTKTFPLLRLAAYSKTRSSSPTGAAQPITAQVYIDSHAVTLQTMGGQMILAVEIKDSIDMLPYCGTVRKILLRCLCIPL